MNITAKKTSTLQGLRRQVNDATTIAAKAESKYESYSNRAQLFQDIHAQSITELDTIKGQWTLFLTLKSSLKALQGTSDDSSRVAEQSYKGIKTLIKKWDAVVQQTIEAADAITLAYDYIVKRKASNPLISNDLVTDAAHAASNATTTVKIVIAALTASLNSLSASNQANNSSELTGLYIGMAEAALLTDPNGKLTQNANIPLQHALSSTLNAATDKQKALQVAVNGANNELATVKEELDSANAKLVSLQAALKAAQTAVNA